MLGLLQGMSLIGDRGARQLNRQPMVSQYGEGVVGQWSGTGRGKTTDPWVQHALMPAVLATLGQKGRDQARTRQ